MKKPASKPPTIAYGEGYLPIPVYQDYRGLETTLQAWHIISQIDNQEMIHAICGDYDYLPFVRLDEKVLKSDICQRCYNCLKLGMDLNANNKS